MHATVNGKRIRVVKYCKKPCHDCPFRRDIPPYITERDAENNIEWLTQGTWPVCHHSVGATLRRNITNNPTGCAGAILFAKKIGLPIHVPEDVSGGETVYRSLAEFAVKSASLKTREARQWAWWASQPKHVRLQLLAHDKRTCYTPPETPF